MVRDKISISEDWRYYPIKTVVLLVNKPKKKKKKKLQFYLPSHSHSFITLTQCNLPRTVFSNSMFSK